MDDGVIWFDLLEGDVILDGESVGVVLGHSWFVFVGWFVLLL